jgi:flagellar protein FliO/FliZ
VLDPVLALACATVALAVVAAPALAQDATGAVPPGGSFGMAAARSFGALAVVLACVVALSYGARRLLRRASGGPGARQAIEIVASRSLGGRSSLTVVEVGGERILVGSTPQSLNLICKLGASDAGNGGREFEDLLRTHVADGVGT